MRDTTLIVSALCLTIISGCEERGYRGHSMEQDRSLIGEEMFDSSTSRQIPDVGAPDDLSLNDVSLNDDAGLSNDSGGAFSPWDKIDMQLPDQPPLMAPPWDPPLGGAEGTFKLRVLLDQRPLAEALITQGGSHLTWETDALGEVWVTIDQEAIEPLILFAASPEARTKGVTVTADQREGVTISLTSFNAIDQPLYPYGDPGEPTRRDTTGQCGHCHLNLNDGWYESPHRSSAKNPIVYDLYTGRGSGHRTETQCLEAGGQWSVGPREGGLSPIEQCYFNISALNAFNEDCGVPCDPSQLGDQAYFGGCADCHAPTVNRLQGGGHDLLSVEGNAFNYGVSCDLCHHVERVREGEPAGVAGRLVIHRPSERGSVSLGGGGYKPLSFGPHADVSNPRMGISPRQHYRDGTLCSGCHQHQHSAEHNAPEIDRDRWPSGKIPNQSTFQEWREGALGRLHSEQNFGEPVACNSCHMTPIPQVMNSANLESFLNADIGIQGGWPRPYGETRAHTWWGPRQPISPILNLSAHLSLSDPVITPPDEAGEPADLEINVTVTNMGTGHGLPSGEPMRHLILVVDAECEGQPLSPHGGDVVHDIGGSIDVRPWRSAGEPWPLAQPGDILRVIRRSGETAYDYDGYGPFRDPRYDDQRGLSNTMVFEPLHKGLMKESAIGSVTVNAVNAQGLLTLNESLPGALGDFIYLDRPTATPVSYAGRAGFTFARVLLGEQGPPMLPHFVAQDMLRDNRLRPGESWTSSHRFPLRSGCDAAEITATLVYRPYPRWLAIERGWFMWDRVVRSASRSLDFIPTPSASSADQLAHPHLSHISAPLPRGLSLERARSTMRGLEISLNKEVSQQSTRRQESWPWHAELLPLAANEVVVEELDQEWSQERHLIGPTALFNLSDHPLAIEPVAGATLYGASIDSSPVIEQEQRTISSSSPSLWIIPPQSGALLIATEELNHVALIAAGYTEHGGRSWTPSTSLGSWSSSPNGLDDSLNINELHSPQIIRRALLEEELQTLGSTPLAIAYQGSPRASRWRLLQSPALSEGSVSNQHQTLHVRNLSAIGQSFSIEGMTHQQWILGAGWSDPLNASWIPVHGEALVRLPIIPPGSYRLGSRETEDLNAYIRFE